jgi:hypothetical protein
VTDLREVGGEVGGRVGVRDGVLSLRPREEE